MVTVVSYATRENLDGEEYIVLVLQGELEMIQSKETGRFYATARKATITSTFDERTAGALVGTQIPGKIIKVSCEPYEWVVPESGELVTLEYRYEYIPEGTESKVIKPSIVAPKQTQPSFSENGAAVV